MGKKELNSILHKKDLIGLQLNDGELYTALHDTSKTISSLGLNFLLQVLCTHICYVALVSLALMVATGIVLMNLL